MDRASFSQYLIEKRLVFDGAMGTALQNNGLPLGVQPENYNLTHPDIIKRIHLNYLEAGADVMTTNTFGANALKFDNYEEVIVSAIGHAKEARNDYFKVHDDNTIKWIALDLGPLGALIEPLGQLSFEEAYALYANQVKVGEANGCDFILIETITDLYEAKIAILASVENSSLPVVCTMSFEASGRTFFGTDVESMVTVLEGLGVSAIGFNCSFGAEEMLPLIEKAVQFTNLPIIVQPNAGLPKIIESVTVYDKDYDHFEQSVKQFIALGVSGIGGCCGTDEKHIETIRKVVDDASQYETHIERKHVLETRVASYAKHVVIGDTVTVIGERLNPTGKKRLKEALLNREYDYVLKEAILQVEQGAEILDVNVGVPGLDEPMVMKEVILKIQAIINAPLQIDSSNTASIEAGSRYYNGKPLINSVNGKRESLDTILPIVKKYGACVIGLTLDDSGIPAKAEDRFRIAETIVYEAEKIGIPRKNILIDCLALTASAQQAEVFETLKTIEMVKSKLGVCTALGVSNVSFGLPIRDHINQAFLTMALYAGLDAPIINPGHAHMMAAVASFEVLANKDPQSKRYIEKYGQTAKVESEVSAKTEMDTNTLEGMVKQLVYAIHNGLKQQSRELTIKIVSQMEPLAIVESIIIPTLNDVGLNYEKGITFLPQLIQSAETVQSAFEILKEKMATRGDVALNRGKVLLATVKHDIHDIGKNIVKVVLENYGYQIFDMGKDVSPAVILDTCLKNDIKLVGLSALMTTTVSSMAETINLLREHAENMTIVVGGAVLSEDTAKQISADYYAKDARDMVKIAEAFFKG